MEICHPHNLNQKPDQVKPYGIRISLPRGATFGDLLGKDWEQHHWFTTFEERDQTLNDMASEHLYSRQGDRPRLIFESIEMPEESDSN
jgi:hypothetical protein|tara:strand:- start:209 stop:472 length:264 start_codon:yes stop_codon:yes gene_type:complete